MSPQNDLTEKKLLKSDTTVAALKDFKRLLKVGSVE